MIDEWAFRVFFENEEKSEIPKGVRETKLHFHSFFLHLWVAFWPQKRQLKKGSHIITTTCFLSPVSTSFAIIVIPLISNTFY